ncbi:Predicted dehydrogenase [Clostridium amylolyticum]|uniref:Predicted dehydrogenase n=1 Tax=Clostridium amylolyticum TaxID=1121298 RepID=A0A1M6GUL3_9CLOT|nr:Gfo/Idh/MocA family oxidoreductase [Clostridium amylolyticum]SHJ13601.1 Predicted dehydrogenase [Clostridium amylolyticum]
MNKKYGVVLIGCGHMGKEHIKNIYYKDNVKVVGVIDIDEEKAKLFAKMYGAESYSNDYKSYLKNDKVNIFIIATYPSTHLPILEDCIKWGKHVICEKPIASSYEEGKEFIKLVRSSKSKVLVGHILRHNESYNKIKDMIAEGVLGTPIIMRMVQNHHTKDWPKYKKLIEETSPIIDCGIHYIDIMRWVTGAEVKSISGICQRTEEDIPKNKYNYGMINLTFTDNSVAFYEAGWGNTIKAQNIKEFIGPKGRITLTYKRDRTDNKEEGDLIEYYKYPENKYEIINVDSNRKPTDIQFNKLIHMIENDEDAYPTIFDVEKAFELSFIADEAIRENKLVII